jgi:hypothetical protein
MISIAFVKHYVKANIISLQSAFMDDRTTRLTTRKIER